MHHVSDGYNFISAHADAQGKIVTRVLLNKNTYTDSLQQSPYFAGIICASMVWVAYGWVTRLVHRACIWQLNNSLALTAVCRDSITRLHTFIVCIDDGPLRI